MRPAGSSESAARLAEPLSHSELRVLRYLPTHLSAPEIAGELSVCTPSSTGTAEPRPSSAPVLWACSHRPRIFELG
jgi:hypothetical protein